VWAGLAAIEECREEQVEVLRVIWMDDGNEHPELWVSEHDAAFAFDSCDQSQRAFDRFLVRLRNPLHFNHVQTSMYWMSHTGRMIAPAALEPARLSCVDKPWRI
jgi:hypothetical protein